MKLKKYKLSDLLATKTQGVNTTTDNIKYVDNGIRIIQAKNISKYEYTFDNENYVSDKTYLKMKENHKLHNGEVLFTNIGSQLGNSVVYDSEEPAIITWNVLKLIPNHLINNYFLCYYLNYRSNYIKTLNSSSTMPFVSGQVLLNMECEIPDLPAQEKIVKIVKTINDKIKLNNQINNNLQELINKTFIEYFVNYNIDNVKLEFVESDIGLIPKGWSIGILSDIVEFSNGYGFDSKKMLDKNENETFSVFKMGNINIGGGINKSKTKSWMKKEDCEGLDKFIAKKGDILMCMTDMKNSGNPLLGHTALIDKDNEFVINQRVGILRCTKGISYEYVYTLSNLDFFISDLRSRANSGVQVNLTTTGICNTQILIPDKDCIDKFNKIAKPLYEKKFNIMQQNETLEQLRDTLLPRLMNGEIDLDKIEI